MQLKRTSVVVIDGYTAVREMLLMVLSQAGGYEVLGQAESGLKAWQLLQREKPELVILDLVLPEMSGLELLRYLRAERRDIKVLVFSAAQSREIIYDALREQPHGYVNKWDSLAVFEEALQVVSRGARYFTASIAEIQDQSRGGSPGAWSSLTGRERTVVQMVAEGKSSKEVAGCLSVSPKTVEHYRTAVMRKLNVRDITALTRYAVRRGLVPLE